MTADVEQVYAFIWSYVTEREALPSSRQIAEALGMSKDEVIRCLWHLRGQKRLCETTLKPTAYDAWWREHVRIEQRWNVKPLWHPPPRRRERQLRLL